MLPALRRNWSASEVCSALWISSAAAEGLSEGTFTLRPEAICCRSVLICCWVSARAAITSGSGLGFTRILALGGLHVDDRLHHAVDGGDNLRGCGISLLVPHHVGGLLIERYAGN